MNSTEIQPTAEGLAKAFYEVGMENAAEFNIDNTTKWEDLHPDDRNLTVRTMEVLLNSDIVKPGASCVTPFNSDTFGSMLLREEWSSVRAFNCFKRYFNCDVDKLYRADHNDVIDARNAGAHTWAVWTVAFEKFGKQPAWVTPLHDRQDYACMYDKIKHCAETGQP